MKIKISSMESTEVKRSPVLDYMMMRLLANIPDYMVGISDFEWMNEVNRVHGKKPVTNETVVQAVKKALPTNKKEYMKKAEVFSALCDPWELFIDAGICNTKCEAL